MRRQRDITDKVGSMSAQALLNLIIDNPHFLTDPYYADIRSAIIARQTELRNGRHPIHALIATERAKHAITPHAKGDSPRTSTTDPSQTRNDDGERQGSTAEQTVS